MAGRDTPLVQPGQVLRTLEGSEAQSLAQDWLAVFRPHGAPSIRQYLWHVFGDSAPCYPALFGDAARAAYLEQQATEFWVLKNDQRFAFVTDQRPTQLFWSDSVVFPPNMAWTMAFTHEDGWIGPIFARHPRWEQLNAENLAQIRKRQEIERARQKGWA